MSTREDCIKLEGKISRLNFAGPQSWQEFRDLLSQAQEIIKEHKIQEYKGEFDNYYEFSYLHKWQRSKKNFNETRDSLKWSVFNVAGRIGR